MKRIRIIVIEIVSIVMLYLFMNSKYIKLIPSCWIYNTTNLYCLSCGGTRCIQNIFRGDFLEAFYSNMVIFLGILYLFIVNCVYTFNIKKTEPKLTCIYPKWWYTIIFVILLIIYTILRNVYML